MAGFADAPAVITPGLVQSGSVHRQLGEVSDPTGSLGSAHRPLLPGSPPGGSSNSSSSNRVRGEGAGAAMARRQTDRWENRRTKHRAAVPPQPQRPAPPEPPCHAPACSRNPGTEGRR